MEQGSTKTQTQNPSPQEVRKDIRARIFSHPNTKPGSELITFFGEKIEVRQPTLKTIMSTRATIDPVTGEEAEKGADASVVDMMIQYCFIPGTDTAVFDEADRDVLLNLPFGKDLSAMSEAFSRLTSLDIEAEAKNSGKTRLSGT